MQIVCIDIRGIDKRRESLTLGKVYNIDLRRDVTFEPSRDGLEKCFWVNGHRYSADRFETVD